MLVHLCWTFIFKNKKKIVSFVVQKALENYKQTNYELFGVHQEWSDNLHWKTLNIGNVSENKSAGKQDKEIRTTPENEKFPLNFENA